MISLAHARRGRALCAALAWAEMQNRMTLSFDNGGAGFDGWALTQHLGGDIRELRSPLRFRSRAGDVYTMPAGMIYDGASIPRAVWSLLPSRDACLEFGTLHDWLYRVGPSLGVHSRSMADSLGWEALVLQDIGDEWQRDAIWDGLRLGAGEMWRFWRTLQLTAEDPVSLITIGP